MKNIISKLMLLIIALPFLSFKNDSLADHPIPLLPNKTLDGKTIDESYYRGHVTIVSFMYIGCMGCMNEITTLNKLKEEYAGNDNVQILCVARQMRAQMMQFNSNDTAKPDSANLRGMSYGFLRKALHADHIAYTIQPACIDKKSAMAVDGNEISIKSECNTITDVYGIDVFPTTLFVDKKGIVRKIEVGGPPTKEDTGLYYDLKKEIDRLLAEP